MESIIKPNYSIFFGNTGYVKLLELINKNFTNYKNLILFMGKNGKQTLNDAFKVWKFEYKEKMSLTSNDSFLVNIKNIKKKFE